MLMTFNRQKEKINILKVKKFPIYLSATFHAKICLKCKFDIRGQQQQMQKLAKELSKKVYQVEDWILFLTRLCACEGRRFFSVVVVVVVSRSIFSFFFTLIRLEATAAKAAKNNLFMFIWTIFCFKGFSCSVLAAQTLTNWQKDEKLNICTIA